VGLVEYFERRASGQHVDASRLFVYKATRRLMQQTGDSGAYLRDAMKALVLLGAPPERYWPYVVADFDKEPPAFCYSLGANWKAVKYFRLDTVGGSTGDTLKRVKKFLADGYPSMFGFTVYESIADGSHTGKIPFPSQKERVEGGHAVMAVGYDDALKIGSRKGALMIRNSWGTGWGEHGYGWLPYAYIETGLADDFWSIQSQTWVDTGAFD
jgi:C1A family cysteine protease